MNALGAMVAGRACLGSDIVTRYVRRAGGASEATVLGFRSAPLALKRHVVMGFELPAPVGEVRAVQPFPAKQRTDFATWFAGGRRAQDALLVSCREAQAYRQRSHPRVGQAAHRASITTTSYKVCFSWSMISAFLSTINSRRKVFHIILTRASTTTRGSLLRWRQHGGRCCCRAQGVGSDKFGNRAGAGARGVFDDGRAFGILAFRSHLSGRFQNMDQQALFRPITKRTGVATQTSRISEMVRETFRTALTPRCGPVALNLPRYLLGESVEIPEVSWPTGRGAMGRPGEEWDLLERVSEILAHATQSPIIAGGGS